jgi:hypothetical protein
MLCYVCMYVCVCVMCNVCMLYDVCMYMYVCMMCNVCMLYVMCNVYVVIPIVIRYTVL